MEEMGLETQILKEKIKTLKFVSSGGLESLLLRRTCKYKGFLLKDWSLYFLFLNSF